MKCEKIRENAKVSICRQTEAAGIANLALLVTEV